MDSQRKIGVALSYVNIVAKNLVNFMYTPFLLHFVGQADYGLFQMTNSVMISLSLLSMGFSSAYVKYYITYKVQKKLERIKQLNAMYLIIFTVISFVALTIGFAITLHVNQIFGRSLSSSQLTLTKYLMRIMIFDVAITFISSVFDSNITVNEKFIVQQGRQLMQTFLVPMLCIPMILLGVGVVSIEITQIIVTIIFLIINVSYCIKKLGMQFEFKNMPFSLLRELAVFSFYIFLNQIVDLINNNMPNFILGMFRGAKMVATFSIAIMIKNLFFMMSTSISTMFIPQINKLVNSHETSRGLSDLMVKVGRVQLSILLFVLGGFIVVGKYFVSAWAGASNIEAYYLVVFMVLPSVVPLSQNIGIEIQRAMNKHAFRFILYIAFAILNIIITIYSKSNLIYTSNILEVFQ